MKPLHFLLTIAAGFTLLCQFLCADILSYALLDKMMEQQKVCMTIELSLDWW